MYLHIYYVCVLGVDKSLSSVLGSDGSSQHLLFPCGNLRKDSLPVMMKTANVRLTEIVCYETCPAEGIRENLSLYHQQNVSFSIFLKL